MLRSKENARLTAARHQVVFLKQKKNHVMSRTGFSSSRKGESRPRGEVQGQQRCMSGPIRKAAIKRVKRRDMLPRRETMTFKQVVP